MPTCRIPPPNRFRQMRASLIKAALPRSSEPAGAPRPFESVTITESHSRVRFATDVFNAAAALNMRAPSMVLAFIFMGFAFAWIYRQGIAANRPWLVQGVRFGIAVALVAQVPLYLIYYVVQPMEGTTVLKQIVGDTLTLIVCGVVVAFINKSTTTAAT